MNKKEMTQFECFPIASQSFGSGSSSKEIGNLVVFLLTEFKMNKLNSRDQNAFFTLSFFFFFPFE